MNKNSVFSDLRKRLSNQDLLGGVILILSTIIALIWANSRFYDLYHYVWHEVKMGFVLGDINTVTSIGHWINDGLMALFFFTIGLEIKREVMAGELSTWKKASLPLAAAIGGMVIPAAFYVFVNATNPQNLNGWGVPMATDIAFALGLLAMLGKKRVPLALKVFLTALAVADDLGAVLVIAFFYTQSIDFNELMLGGFFLVVLMGANYLGVRRTVFYGLVGFMGVWLAFVFSGVHATIAGVLIAFTIPARTKISESEYVERLCRLTSVFENAKPNKNKLLTKKQLMALNKIDELNEKAHTPIQKLEHALHPISTFIILPLFALSNAGVRIEGNILELILSPISIGIIVGLTLGKPIGIALASKLVAKLKIASLPEGMNWRHVYGAGFLAGIGFTMSIFISELAFETDADKQIAKVGIFVASILSAIIGMTLLSKAKS
jgi:NhaA family Na+:H+ antiporter